MSSGYDNIDAEYCIKRGIIILNVYGGNVIAAAEHTIMMILASAKKLIKKNSEMHKGIFANINHSISELYGKDIGVIGVGRIGSLVAKYARNFGMNVYGNDINAKLKDRYKWIKFVSLNTLLKKSDVITIHTPLDNSTIHLLNKNNLKLLKPNAILINCSRGGTIDEESLIKILQKKKIACAAMDVFKDEPNFNKKFAKFENVLLTPHIAGKTIESKEKMTLIAAENIIKYYSKAR